MIRWFSRQRFAVKIGLCAGAITALPSVKHLLSALLGGTVPFSAPSRLGYALSSLFGGVLYFAISFVVVWGVFAYLAWVNRPRD